MSLSKNVGVPVHQEIPGNTGCLFRGIDPGNVKKMTLTLTGKCSRLDKLFVDVDRVVNATTKTNVLRVQGSQIDPVKLASGQKFVVDGLNYKTVPQQWDGRIFQFVEQDGVTKTAEQPTAPLDTHIEIRIDLE